MRTASDYSKIISILQELHKKYPYNVGRHISTALSDYGDLWGISDKEFYKALDKYKSLLELDLEPMSQEYVDNIIKDAENLTTDEEEY